MNTNTNETPAAAKPEVAEFRLTLWTSKKQDFEKKVAHLNRILKKHGKTPITYRYENVRSEMVKFHYHIKGEAFANDEYKEFSVEACDAVCKGITIVKKDDAEYVYLGTVSFVEGVKQVFCNNEAYKDYFMDGFRDHYCDHCGTRRTNRKTYWLFLNRSNGKVLQIGSACAKEYFGIDSTAFLETYGRTFICLYDGSEEEAMGFQRGSRTYSFAEVAPAVSLCTNGFLKWNKRGGFVDFAAPIHERPTVNGVDTVLASWEGIHPIRPSDGDRENCSLVSYDEVLAYWEEKSSKEGSSFAYNCREAVKAGYTTYKSLGSFCWAIFAAYNAKVREIREKEAAAAAMKSFVPCAYAGGSRQTIKGVITNIRSFESVRPNSECWRNNYYGDEMTKWAVDFTEENGTLYHFTTSAGAFADFHNGDRIQMRCTIGETKPFKGVPYTHISRPKAERIGEAAA